MSPMGPVRDGSTATAKRSVHNHTRLVWRNVVVGEVVGGGGVHFDWAVAIPPGDIYEGDLSGPILDVPIEDVTWVDAGEPFDPTGLHWTGAFTAGGPRIAADPVTGVVFEDPMYGATFRAPDTIGETTLTTILGSTLGGSGGYSTYPESYLIMGDYALQVSAELGAVHLQLYDSITNYRSGLTPISGGDYTGPMTSTLRITMHRVPVDVDNDVLDVAVGSTVVLSGLACPVGANRSILGVTIPAFSQGIISIPQMNGTGFFYPI